MKTRRRSYTAETPASLFPEAPTVKPIVQALPAPCTADARGDGGSKRKCIRLCTRLWDLKIPSDLLQEILSRLGLKANVQASAVCKTWFKAAVSVRKLQPRPWPFYPLRGSDDEDGDKDSPPGTYILVDPLRSKSYKLNFPELKDDLSTFYHSQDGWLLTSYLSQNFFLNPLTQERIYLPKVTAYALASSAAPTASNCLVISFVPLLSAYSSVMIRTWRPGATAWTTHLFKDKFPARTWDKCVFSNGMFYCLSTCGYLGVFDPLRATWNVLPVKPCSLFRRANLGIRKFIMEHEGDVFVMSTLRDNNNPSVFKLNLKRKVWEEKRELGGLTIFASFSTSLIRAGLSVEENNRIYPSHNGRHGMYYSLGDDEGCSRPFSSYYFCNRIAWMNPPHESQQR